MAGFPRLKPGQGRVNEPTSNTGSPACPPKHFHCETRSTHGTHAAVARSAIDSDSTGSQSRWFLRKKMETLKMRYTEFVSKLFGGESEEGTKGSPLRTCSSNDSSNK